MEICSSSVATFPILSIFSTHSSRQFHFSNFTTFLHRDIIRLYNISLRSHTTYHSTFVATVLSGQIMSGPTKSFHRFFDLPAELRCCVYNQLSKNLEIRYQLNFTTSNVYEEEALFAAGEGVLSTRDQTRPARLRGLPRKCAVMTAYLRSARDFAIAYASQRLSDEFLHEVYLHQTFKFLIYGNDTTSWTPWNVSDTVLQQVRHVRFVRQCIVNIRPSACGYPDGKRRIYFAGLVVRCPRLQTIETEVQLSPETITDPRFRDHWDWESTVAGRRSLSNVWHVPRERWESSKSPEGPWLI